VTPVRGAGRSGKCGEAEEPLAVADRTKGVAVGERGEGTAAVAAAAEGRRLKGQTQRQWPSRRRRRAASSSATQSTSVITASDADTAAMDGWRALGEGEQSVGQ
jgi:hypothetical protein